MANKKEAEAVRRNNQVVATNRKARHNYSIIETFEAGVALMGTEVKSLRDGTASLADAHPGSLSRPTAHLLGVRPG